MKDFNSKIEKITYLLNNVQQDWDESHPQWRALKIAIKLIEVGATIREHSFKKALSWSNDRLIEAADQWDKTLEETNLLYEE